MIVKYTHGYINSIPRQTFIGFCHRPKRGGRITESLIKHHECDKKDCCFFEKYNDHPYWIRSTLIALLNEQKENKCSIYINNEKQESNDITVLCDKCMRYYRETGEVPTISTKKVSKTM